MSSGNRKPVIEKLKRTCYACPSQWEGRDTEGYPYYIRYRWDHLTVSKGKRYGHIDTAIMAEPYFSKTVKGDGISGILDFNELKEQLKYTLVIKEEIEDEDYFA